jgi:hypothetical protein
MLAAVKSHAAKRSVIPNLQSCPVELCPNVMSNWQLALRKYEVVKNVEWDRHRTAVNSGAPAAPTQHY